MTWTYIPDFTTSRDQVRWLAGDTDGDDPLASDEEIAFALTQDSNVYRAAARVCRAIALRVGARLTTNASGTGVDADEQHRHWMEAAEDLERQAAQSGAAAYVGGASVSDKAAVAGDSDRARPTFTRALHAGAGDTLGSTESALVSIEG